MLFRSRRHLTRAADLRYLHQGHELSVPAPDGPLTAAALAAIEEAFHQEHRRLYTYDLRGQTVELVNLRVTATGLLSHGQRRGGEVAASSVPRASSGERRVYFGVEHGWRTVACHTREALTPGVELTGPLAVDHEDSTTVAGPGQRFVVDTSGNLIIRVASTAN